MTFKEKYHQPSSVDELIAQNVRTVAELEKASQVEQGTGDRVARVVTRISGSMGFVWTHAAAFALWIGWNTLGPIGRFDPYPFTFLTLVVSLEAIFLSTFIMIAENRQERLDKRRAQLDLQINLLAEQESTKILNLLERVCRKMGVDASDDPEIAMLEQATRPEALIDQIAKAEVVEKHT